jgi:hypothetical protein
MKTVFHHRDAEEATSLFLCALGVSVVNPSALERCGSHHRDTEDTEKNQFSVLSVSPC